ncbi:MAG TPA: alanine racemase [Mesorhizobium sp.]|jgi:predicted amino acid racemase|nr:alanine racemase [Mesorhizobium sp.]
MFLDVLRRRNPRFVEAAMALHQAGKIPANSYVLDLDAVESNARTFMGAARPLGLKVFAMTKQVGRNSGFCKAVMRGGIDRAVAVDMACAVACQKAELSIGHLGHLVQIPRHEADHAARTIRADFWTVFSEEKAREAASAAYRADRTQHILARIQTGGDIFYRGHEGGFPADEIVEVAAMLDGLDGTRFAGVTSFPALLFDAETRSVKPTHNLQTLHQAASALRRAGRNDIEINAPGTTSTVTLPALAEAGATQVEPGNGLHGTTPLHALEDLPELPAVLYVTEVSHLHGDRAYCFGGGLYIDPVFPPYDVKAIVSPEPTVDGRSLLSVEIPPPSAIDYYGMIDATGARKPEPGDSVVFGFRGQAFVKRAFIVGVSGISRGAPSIETIENIFGQPEAWPNLQ